MPKDTVSPPPQPTHDAPPDQVDERNDHQMLPLILPALRHRISSRLDDHCQVAQPSAPVASTDDPAEAFTYFWELVEAQSADDLDYLWPDFERRSRELAALARAEDIKITLYHLTRAVQESPLLARWEHAMHSAAILKAISAAVVS